MKKLSSLLLLLLLYCSSYAQTVSFSLTTAPCNNNGVLQATASGISGTVTYSFYGTNYAALIATNTSGTLTSYTGGPINVIATNGTTNAYGSYIGAPPFNYTTTTTTATCPAMSTASVNITGGTSPFTVQWRLNGTTTTIATGTTVSLPQNSYDVFITDAAGCTYGSVCKV